MKVLKEFIDKHRKRLPVIIAAAGVLIISLSYAENFFGISKATQESLSQGDELEIYGTRLEDKLKSTLCSVLGNNSVEVMITFSSTFENIYARSTVDDGFSQNSTQELSFSYTSQQKNSEPVIVKRNCPKISGVMIVCKKMISPSDCTTIKKAVSAALNISESKIYIIGGEANNEKISENR